MTVEQKRLGSPVLPVDVGGDDERDQPGGMFDLAALLRMVRMRYRIILGTAFLVVTIAAVSVFSKTPLYDASALVILDQRQNKVADVNAVLSGLPNNYVTVQNQLEILRSRELMSSVIDKLHLDQTAPVQSKPSLLTRAVHLATYYVDPRHWFGGAAGKQMAPQDRRDALINGLLGGETVAVVGDSAAIRITYRSPNPAQSATVANAIANAYVEDQLNAKFEATQKTSQWLADRLQQLSGQMQAADTAVQQYKATHHITDIGGNSSLLDQQLAQLNSQLVSARSDLAATEAKYKRVQALQASGRAEDVAQVFQSGLISALRQQQTQLLQQKAQLSTVYGPRHPKMLDIESQLRDIDTKIKNEVARVVETLSNDVSVARAQVQSLEASLQKLEKQSDAQSKAEVNLVTLNAAASSAHQLYDAFLAKFKSTEGQDAIQTPDARIISKAVVPNAPAVPNKKRTLIFSLAGGLFLGFAAAWLAERLDAGFRTTAQVEHTLGIPVLGTLPELTGMGGGAKQAADRVISNPLSSFAEAIRGVQMGLNLFDVDRPPKVILVTSSVPGESKTTTSLAIARAISSTGRRVLLIDADLRQAGLSEMTGVTLTGRGLLDVMGGQAQISERIVKDPLTDVCILPTAKLAGRPPDLLGSARMSALIQTVKSGFDTVIIDSAPLLPVHDSRVLAGMADAVLFALRWDKTPREAASNALRSLAGSTTPVAGIVLTRASLDRYRYYNYGYQSYSKYERYYGS